MKFIIKRSLIFIFLILLNFITVSLDTTAQNLIVGGEVELGETVRVTTNTYFPILNYFKPIYEVPTGAQDIKVDLIIQNGTEIYAKEIFFEKYTYNNYQGLRTYIKKACSPDEKGYITYDEGFIYEVNGLRIEQKKGYCEIYSNIIPTEKYDLILINHTYISLPLEHFRISYNRIKDPLKNGVQDYYKPYVVKYYLPKDNFVWYSNVNLSPVKSLLPDGRIVIEADYSKLRNVTEIIFDYGSKEEYDNKVSLISGIIVSLIGLLVTILGIFEPVKYYLYKRIKLSIFIITNFIFVLCVLIIFYIYINPVIVYFRLLIEPFFSKYLNAVYLIFGIFFILYLLLFIPLLIIYEKCKICGKIYKKSYVDEHIKNVHKNVKSNN